MGNPISRRDLLKKTLAAGLVAASGGCIMNATNTKTTNGQADLLIHNGRIATLKGKGAFAQAAAIKDGRFIAVGTDHEVLKAYRSSGHTIDLQRRTVIPGLNDSHLHVIRGGLNYNMELRWDGVPSVADALRMLQEQARRTPPPQWVRVVGGWSEFQFKERRMPTLQEINAMAPETPVFILHLYGRALLNRAALQAVGYTKDTPDPPGGVIERDKQGNPTGLLIAKPSALILYSTLSMGPKLSLEDQANSSRHFMRELNRLGLTSAIDAGGGGQNYPEDYEVIKRLSDRDEMSMRIGFHLFAQKAGSELEDYQRWTTMTSPGKGDAMLQMVGAGENLTWSAADFENFLEPRPDLRPDMDENLKAIVTHLAKHRWPFRIHATYDESISRFLNVFESVNQDVPLEGLHWFLDHAETISERSLERVKALGGGIAIQHRMAYQGEYFIQRYGEQAAHETPPIQRMLAMGLPVGGGTDATRVASFNPWVSLYWLVSGKTVGGTALYPSSNHLDRQTALELYTIGSSWFSNEQGQKGAIESGQLADFAVLSEDYFSVPEEEIKDITSILTVVDGRVVYAAQEFSKLDPPPLPVSPSWSPVGTYGGFAPTPHSMANTSRQTAHVTTTNSGSFFGDHLSKITRTLDCDCFAY